MISRRDLLIRPAGLAVASRLLSFAARVRAASEDPSLRRQAETGLQDQIENREARRPSRRDRVKVLKASGKVASLAWGADETNLAVQTGKIELWDTRTGRKKRTFLEVVEPIFFVCRLVADQQLVRSVLVTIADAREQPPDLALLLRCFVSGHGPFLSLAECFAAGFSEFIGT